VDDGVVVDDQDSEVFIPGAHDYSCLPAAEPTMIIGSLPPAFLDFASP